MTKLCFYATEFQEIVDKLSAGSGGESGSEDPHDHAHRRRRSILQLLAKRAAEQRRSKRATNSDDHDHDHEGEVHLDVHSVKFEPCFPME